MRDVSAYALMQTADASKMTRLCGRLAELSKLAQLLSPTGEKSAADSAWYKAKSDIDGDGVFAAKDLAAGEVIGVAMVDGGKDEVTGSKNWNLTVLGRYCNHQNNNNVIVVKADDRFNLVAKTDISQDEELVSSYFQVTKALGPYAAEMLWEGKAMKRVDIDDFTEREVTP